MILLHTFSLNKTFVVYNLHRGGSTRLFHVWHFLEFSAELPARHHSQEPLVTVVSLCVATRDHRRVDSTAGLPADPRRWSAVIRKGRAFEIRDALEFLVGSNSQPIRRGSAESTLCSWPHLVRPANYIFCASRRTKAEEPFAKTVCSWGSTQCMRALRGMSVGKIRATSLCASCRRSHD